MIWEGLKSGKEAIKQGLVGGTDLEEEEVSLKEQILKQSGASSSIKVSYCLFKFD